MSYVTLFYIGINDWISGQAIDVASYVIGFDSSRDFDLLWFRGASELNRNVFGGNLTESFLPVG